MMPKFKTRTFVAALAVAAIAAPSASAARIDQMLPSAAQSSVSPVVPTSRTVEVDSTGFDWGDAAIGAAATVSLLTLGAGTVLVTRRSRRAAPAS
jgi:hypothetical protein